tara:strand:+ start:1192 stop:4149 length:2958 start_codon:yes stop_codon:yes gene_type:complete
MIKCFALGLFLLFNGALFGQKLSFVTYGTKEGLPQSQVTAMTQDERGYLWIGTLGGLAKFNGNQFVSFSSKDGLLNNRITALSAIGNTLWIGHNGGLSYLENSVIKNIEYSGEGAAKSQDVSKIIQFKKQLFVCSNGGGLFIKKGNRLENIPLDSLDYNRIRSAEVYNNQLYLATRGGVLISSDGLKFELLNEIETYSFSGIAKSEERMVFSTFSHGVYIKELSTNKITHITESDVKHKIYGCYIDQNELIWLNTLKGIVQIDSDNEIFFLNDESGLPINTIGCFYEDVEGGFWIGSQGKGIFKYPGLMFNYFNVSTGLPSDLYISGIQTKKGDFYLGSFDFGLVKKSASGDITRIRHLSRSIWTSIENVNGKNWFGTESSLLEMNENDNIIIHDLENDGELQLPGKKITALYKTSPTSMMIGGNRGVSIYENGQFKHYGSNTSRELGTVRDFELDDDKLYCVTERGLMLFKNNRFDLVEGGDKSIHNIEKEEDGTIWLGTEEGLYKFKNDEFERVELSDNPASNFIAFLNYRKGKLYVGTNNGFFILSDLKNEKKTIKRYGISEGLIDIESNLNSGFFDIVGDFWFGTASGLVCYHEDESNKETSNPKINLINILLNYKSFEYEKYSSEIDERGFPTSMELPYNLNTLNFEVDGILLGQHSKLKYQFKLEGQQENWSSLSPNNIISFSSLPAGDYILHIRAGDVDGGLSEEFILPFIISPPFYATWWFYLFVFLLVAGLTYAFFQFRIRRIAELNEKDKIVFKAKLLALEQQSMNASMNRHFIFNSLNSIQYFINTQDRFSANKYLTNFAKLIRKNLDASTTSENVISLADELERIQLYLSLESMRFKDRFEYEINVHDVDTEYEMIPAMIMQPFIENSIIHGILPDEEKKGLITIDISIKSDLLEILIEDNGIGIEHSLSKKVRTEGDHQSKGMEITSKRIELIQKVSENEISMVGPRQIVDENGLINGTSVLIKIPRENLVD